MSKTALIFTDFSIFPPVSGTRMLSVRMLVQTVITAVHVLVLFSRSLRQETNYSHNLVSKDSV